MLLFYFLLYFHQGWGCGYRSLQTICSWISQRMKTDASIPSIPRIQEVLVAMGDKEKEFIGSKQWIGSVEVGLVIDKIYDVSMFRLSYNYL